VSATTSAVHVPKSACVSSSVSPRIRNFTVIATCGMEEGRTHEIARLWTVACAHTASASAAMGKGAGARASCAAGQRCRPLRPGGRDGLRSYRPFPDSDPTSSRRVATIGGCTVDETKSLRRWGRTRSSEDSARRREEELASSREASSSNRTCFRILDSGFRVSGFGLKV